MAAEQYEYGRPRSSFDAAKLAPVFFVASLILLLWALYTFNFLVPLYLASPADKVFERYGENTKWYAYTYGGIFHVCGFLMLAAYHNCIFTNPGSVPDVADWQHSQEDASDQRGGPTTQETKKSGGRRHCKWCGKYKPDRCHHCRKSGTCVLRMDHHCPWLNNCIGFYNHKYFFLLLLYAVICLWFIVATMLSVEVAFRNDIESHTWFLLLFTEMLAGFMGIVMTGFFSFHLYLMSRNITTVEFCEKSLRKSGYSSNLYDLGVIANFQSILGDNILTWVLPFACFTKLSGDGLSFVNENSRLSVDIESGSKIRSAGHRPQQRSMGRGPRGGYGMLEEQANREIIYAEHSPPTNKGGGTPKPSPSPYVTKESSGPRPLSPAALDPEMERPALERSRTPPGGRSPDATGTSDSPRRPFRQIS